MTYRADIDGLRAIAVAGVVLFHAKLGVPGGYAGVDVFFVISGFLITKLLLRDLQSGCFSMVEFWERRVRRIFPALAVVLAATLAVGWFMLLPRDYSMLGRRLVAVIGFASNIKSWREEGYFADSSEENPLLHAWSLSVEEQFYLIVPIALTAIWWLRRERWVAPLLAAGILISFFASVVGTYLMPSATFFLLPTRAWELGIGALLAFAPAIRRARLRSALGWLGLTAVLFTFFHYSSATLFPGASALPPVLGASAIIWGGMMPSGETQPRINRWLAARPLVWLGLVSYSFYLWHWPIFALHKYWAIAAAGVIGRIAMVGAALGLAWFSLHWIERPIRNRAWLNRKQVFSLSAVIALILLAVGGLISLVDGLPRRITPLAARFAAGRTDAGFTDSHSLADVPNNLLHLGSPSQTPGIFLWGDSHAAALIPVIDEVCTEQGIPAVAAISSSTPPVLDWYFTGRFGLNEKSGPYNAAVLDEIITSVREMRISWVILAARWDSYVSDPVAGPTFPAAFAATLSRLAATGCRVFIVQEVPYFDFNVPRTLALHCQTNSEIPEFAMSQGVYAARSQAQLELFRQCIAAAPNNIKIIDPSQAFALPNGQILPADSQGCFFRDRHHLSIYGSRRLAPQIRDVLATP